MSWVPLPFYSLEPSKDRLYREFMDDDNELPPVLTDMHMRQVIYSTSAMGFNYFCSTAHYPEGVDTAMVRALTADCTRTGERSEGDPAYMNALGAFKRFNEASLEIPCSRSQWTLIQKRLDSSTRLGCMNPRCKMSIMDGGSALRKEDTWALLLTTPRRVICL